MPTVFLFRNVFLYTKIEHFYVTCDEREERGKKHFAYARLRLVFNYSVTFQFTTLLFVAKFFINYNLHMEQNKNLLSYKIF